MLSPPSLHHFVMQGVLPSVVVLGCGSSFARVRLCEDPLIEMFRIYTYLYVGVQICVYGILF